MHREGGSGAINIARRLISLAPALAIAADVWVQSPASAAPAAQPRPATSAAISQTVTLSGSLHPKARPELDVGRMDPGVHLSGMSLLFRMSRVQRAMQERELAEVQDPGSPRYHQWLTPEQYAAEFGATGSDVARAAAWLTSQGLTVDGPSRTATRLGFSGTIAQIEQAFHTQMHRYRVAGEVHFAMSRAPSVPADLADSVLGLHGLHDFRAQAPSQRAQPQYALPITGPDGGPGIYTALSPADFAKIYDLDSLYAAHITGAGQSIAVAERSDFNDADIAAFRTTFGLPVNQPVRILVPNSGSSVANESLEEAELDLEWAGAVAPEATIQSVFIGNAPNSNTFDSLFYAIEQRIAPVLSTSYGSCERWFTPADASFIEEYGATASLEGMTVLGGLG
jgi:subtilase family serine protease